MFRYLQDTLAKSKSARIILAVYGVLALWWLSIFVRGLQDSPENHAFTLMYGWLSLVGFLFGMSISKKWGGYKSVLGRSLFYFSLGLFAQFFGQMVYAYFIYVQHIEVPYPSLGDVGYFGSILCYIYAVVLLGKVVGSKKSLRIRGKFLETILIPLVLLIASYLMFLRGYVFDWDYPLVVLLDFGYPLGQAVYVSLALSVFYLSRNVLGGRLKYPVLFLIVALVVQYLCDYTFLYQASHGTWYVAGPNDFMYFTSYLLMTLGLLQIGVAFHDIRNKPKE